jgi:hypothetical protein
VRFDNYYLESSLYTSGRVDATVARLVASGKTYEEGGALWLRTTDYGDDKDRVMRKSDGSYTYFVPDVAYHLAKFERGFAKAIDIQGTDHHGTIARVRAGLQAADMGVPPGYPDYVLNTMVRVERDGQEVKLSKRAGSYVTLRDLIEWTSKDAVRFFMLSRKADTEFTFDIDLALKRNDENPVFYVQYAHARISSVIREFAAQGGDVASLASADLARLSAPSETALLRKLADYPRDARRRRGDAGAARGRVLPARALGRLPQLLRRRALPRRRRRAGPSPPRPPGGHPPGHPQCAGAARRRRARAHGQRTGTRMKSPFPRRPARRLLIGMVIGLLIGLASRSASPST